VQGGGGVPRQQGSATRWGAVPSAKSSASNIASDPQCSSPNAPATSAVSPLAVFPSSIRWGVSPGYASAPRIAYRSNHGMPHTESGVFLI
jgi:hypothetical protein